MLLGALVWLAWLALRGAGRIPWRFALFGAAGGLGFGAGGALMSLGHNVPIGPPWYDWWKVMELVFGLCFGAALGLCAWVYRGQLRGGGQQPPDKAQAANPWLQFILAAVFAFCAIESGRLLHLRMTYSVLGAVMLWIALRWPRFAWHIAITLTFFAFARDLVRFAGVQQFGSPSVAWTLAILSSAAACGWILDRLRRARPMTGWAFLFLLWSAVLVSWAKALLHPGPMRAGAINETLFTVVGSQNHIRRGAQRFVTVNCCRILAHRGFGQAVPSVSFWKRDRGTARHTLFEATFWAMWSAVLSARRILGSIHRSPMVQAETARANYAASRQ